MSVEVEKQQARRKPARLTILATSTGAGMGILGTVVGILWLGILLGLPSPIDSRIILIHPDLQIFGFLTLFVMGVAYSAIPRFKNKPLRHPRAAAASILLVTFGNVLLLVDAFLPSEMSGRLASDLTILLGAVVYAFIALRTLGRPSGPLASAEPFMALSVVALLLSLVNKLASDLSLVSHSYSYSSPAVLQLALIGFPTLMIFGVAVRTVHFRIVTLRRKLVKAGFIPSLAGVSLSFVAIFSPLEREFTFVSSVLFTAAGMLFVAAINGLGDEISAEQYARMNERDRNRYIYFSPVIRIASAWLLAGLLLSVAASLDLPSSGTLGLRDAFIHSVAVGFIGTTIMGYGAILLPPLTSGRTPFRGLTLTPIWLITAGNIWRVAGSILTRFGVVLWPTWFSGVLVLAGMTYFLWMVHSLQD